MERKAYPSDVSDEEWALVAPYLTLMTEDAPQREYPLREVFNGLRWIVRTGAQWRWLPHDLPPWPVVYQQSQRWIKAGVFESLVHDLRAVLRIADGRKEGPTAAILDSRTLQSTPESGSRAGYDGAKRRKGSKVHLHPSGVPIENCRRVPASQSAVALHRRQVPGRSPVPNQDLLPHYDHDHTQIRTSRIRKLESPEASFVSDRSCCKSDSCISGSLFQTSGRRFQPCFSLLRKIAPRPRQEWPLLDGGFSPSRECSSLRRRSGQSARPALPP